MANKKIQATAQLFLNTKDAQKDAQQFIADLKQKLSDIESAADKMTVFKDMVDYIAQVDRAMTDLKKHNEDAFSHMFDGLDKNLKKQLESVFSVDGGQLGQLDVLRERLSSITTKSSITEIKKFAKELNALYASVGMNIPFANIDAQFTGRTTQKYIDDLTQKVSVFGYVWKDVNAQISKGFGGTGSGGIGSAKIEKEIKSLEIYLEQYKKVKEELQNLSRVREDFLDTEWLDESISIEYTIDSMKQLAEEFKIAKKLKEDFEASGDTSSLEYYQALSRFAKSTLQANDVWTNSIMGDKALIKELKGIKFDKGNLYDAINDIIDPDNEEIFDDLTGNINGMIDKTEARIVELNEKLATMNNSFGDGSGVSSGVENIGDAASQAENKVDALGKKLINISEYVSALSGQLKEMFSATGRRANFEYHIAIDGLDIKARHGSEASVDLETQTETYLDTLFSESAIYGHSHRGGISTTNISDVKNVLSAYRDGVSIPVHFVVGKDSITTIDFTGLSKDMVNQLIQEIDATNDIKNAALKYDVVDKIVEKYTGKSGAFKTWNVEQFDDLAKYLYDVSSAAASALTPIEKFQAVLDNMFGNGKVDASKYESLLSSLNKDNAKSLFNQIASAENLQPIQPTDMLTMGQVNAEIDESIAKYKTLREEANLSYSDIRREVDKVLELYKSGGEAKSSLEFFLPYFPDGEWQNVRELLTNAYDGLISIEEVTNRIANEFAVDPATFAQIPTGTQGIDETSQKLREQEQLWENVKTAIKSGLGEAVGLDNTAMTLEVIENEIKEGILTSLEECIARFKEFNNISDDESLHLVGERQRVIEDYYGTYLPGSDEVVSKEEADKLRQLSVQQEQLYQNLRSAIKGTLSDVVDVDDMTYVFDTIEKEIREGLLTTLDQCVERFKFLTGLDDKRLTSIGDYQRVADDWDYYRGDRFSDEVEAAEQAAEEAQKRAEEAESDALRYQEAANRLLDEKSELQREIDTLREQLTTQTDTGYKSQLTQEEVTQLEALQQKLLEVKAAIDAKTQAFEEEYVTVDSVVDTEVASLQSLVDQLESVAKQVRLVGDAFNGINTNTPNVESNDVSTENTHYLTDFRGNRKLMYRGVNGSIGGLVSNRYHGGTFFTDLASLAKRYAGIDGKVETANISMKNPLEIDAHEHQWDDIEYLGNCADEASEKIRRLRKELDQWSEWALSNRDLKVNLLDEDDFGIFEQEINDMLSDEWHQSERGQKDRDRLTAYLELARHARQSYLDISNDDSNVYGYHDTNKFVELAKSAGYDGVVFRNIKDGTNEISNIVVTLQENQIHFVETLKTTFDSLLTDFIGSFGKIEDFLSYYNEFKTDKTLFHEVDDGIRPVFGNQLDKYEELAMLGEPEIINEFLNKNKILGAYDKCVPGGLDGLLNIRDTEERIDSIVNFYLNSIYELERIQEAFNTKATSVEQYQREQSGKLTSYDRLSAINSGYDDRDFNHRESSKYADVTIEDLHAKKEQAIAATNAFHELFASFDSETANPEQLKEVVDSFINAVKLIDDAQSVATSIVENRTGAPDPAAMRDFHELGPIRETLTYDYLDMLQAEAKEMQQLEIDMLNAQEQRIKAEQEAANAVNKKTQANVISDETVQAEIGQLNQLGAVLGEVKNAVLAKTKAFYDEGTVVGQVVGKEISALKNLLGILDEIVPKVNTLSAKMASIKPIDFVAQNGADDTDTSGSTTSNENKFQTRVSHKKGAMTKYIDELNGVQYVTDETREKLVGLRDAMDTVKTPQDLDGIIEKFEALQERIGILKSSFEDTGLAPIRGAKNSLLSSYKAVDADQKAEVERLLDEVVLQLNTYEHMVLNGQKVEIRSIEDTVKALRDKLETYKEINKEAKKAGVSTGGNASFGSTASINATAKYNSLVGKANSAQFANSSEIESRLTRYKDAYDKLIKARDELRAKESVDESDIEAFKTLTTQCNEYAKSLEKIINDTIKLKSGSVNDYDYMLGSDFVDDKQGRIDVLTSFVKEMYGVTLSATDFKDNWNKAVFAVDNGDKTFTQMTATFTAARNEIVAMAGDTKKSVGLMGQLWDQYKGKLKSTFTYFLSTISIYDVWRVIKQGVGYVKEIDSALTELKKVTDETDASYAKFLKDMSKTGGVIGATVKDLTTMAAEWARLGYSMEEAGKLAKSTAILLNVSEFEDATKASEALISTMQAFQYTADESQHVVDILNEVGNNYAVSSDGIASALQDSASALMAGGNNLEQAVALVAAANRVVQDPNSVGSALRTISLRLRGTSVEILEQMGEETDNVVESTSKLQSKIKALSGVNILAESGDYKDTYTILKEIGTVWEDMSDIDQAALLELMAGKNRANTLSAILSNMEDLEGAYNDALDAEGSALKENEAYLDSIQGRIDLFNNSLQTMWMNLIDSETIKGFVDWGTKIIKSLDTVPGRISAIVKALSLLMAFKKINPFESIANIINLKNTNGIGATLKNLAGTLFGVTTAMKAVTAETVANTIATQTNDAAKAKQIMTEFGLVGVTGTLNEAQKQAIATKILDMMTTKQLTGDQVMLTMAQGNAMLAMLGYAGATMTADGSLKILDSTTKSFMATNPVGWILAIVSALIAVVTVISSLIPKIDDLEEDFNNLNSGISSMKSEIESINSELETTRDRMAELLAMDSLSFVEEEELNNLKLRNDELERQLKLQEEMLKIKQEEQKNQAKILIGSKWDSANLDKAYAMQDGVIVEDTWNTTGRNTKELLDEAMADYDKIKAENESNHKAYAELLKAKNDGTTLQSDFVNRFSEAMGINYAYFDDGGTLSIEAIDNLINIVERELAEQDAELTKKAAGIDMVLSDMSEIIKEGNLSYSMGDDEVDNFLDEYYAYSLKWSNAYGAASKSSVISAIWDNTESEAMKQLKAELDEIAKSGEDRATKEQKAQDLIQKALDDTTDKYERLETFMGTVGVTAGEMANYFVAASEAPDIKTIEGVAEVYQDGIDVLKKYKDERDAILGKDENGQDITWGNLFTEDKDGKMVADKLKIAAILEGADETIRDQFTKIVESVENGEMTVDQAFAKWSMSGFDKTLDILNSEFEDLNNETFASVADDISGMIDTFSELKSACEDVASSIDLIASAQKQMNGSGRISVKTALELIESTEDWDKILNITNGTITLAANAEEILAQSKLNTIKVQLQYAYQMAEARYQTALTAAGELEYAANDNVVMTAESIKAEAIGRVSAVVVALGVAIDELLKGNFGGAVSAFGDTYTSATAAVVAESNTMKTSVADAQKARDEAKARLDLFDGIDDNYDAFKNYWDYDETPGDKYDDSDSKDPTELDWLDHYLTDIENQIEEHQARLENIVMDTDYLKGDNTIFDQIIGLYDEKSKKMQDALATYNSRADYLFGNLPSWVQTAINNGSLDISSIADEDLAANIEEYYEYVDAASNLRVELENLKQEIADIAKQKFDNIVEAYENILNLGGFGKNGKFDFDGSQVYVDSLQKQIDLAEASGEEVGEAYYQAMIDAYTSDGGYIDILEAQKTAMQDALDGAVLNNQITVGSEQWYEMVNAIYDVDGAIIDAKISLEEWQTSINDMNSESFDDLINKIDHLASEIDFLYGLLSDDDKVVDEFGNWTGEGIAALGLMAQEMERAKEEAELYGKEIDSLNAAYADGKYSQEEYEEKLMELKEGQWSAIEAAESAKDAIIELNKVRVESAKKVIQDEIDAYSELIAKKREELDIEKDAYDFQKKVQESQKSISDIQRRLAALANDNSASANAERRKLQAELNQSLTDLEEIYYEESISNQQDALDKELEDYEEARQDEIDALDEYLKNVEQVVQDSLTAVIANADTTLETLNTYATEHGFTLSEELRNPWVKAAEEATAFKNSATGELGELIDAEGILQIWKIDATDDLVAPWTSGEDAINKFSSHVTTALSTIRGELDTAATNASTKAQQIIADMKSAMSEITKAQNAANNVTYTPNVGGNSNVGSSSTSGSGSGSGGSGTGGTGGATSSDPNVVALQKFLNNYFDANLSVDGIYGSLTKAAVKKMQKTIGSVDDGLYNSETKKKLEEYFSNLLKLTNKEVAMGGDVSQYKEYYKNARKAIPLACYAKGTTGVKDDQWAFTDELGPELTLHAGPNGQLQYLTKGSGVVTADLTKRLMEWGELDPSQVLKNSAPKLGAPHITTNNMEINLRINEVVHIDHADSNSIQDITSAVQKQMDQYMKNVNQSLKRFAR